MKVPKIPTNTSFGGMNMRKKHLVLLLCLLVFASASAAPVDQNNDMEEVRSRLEQQIGRLPKSMAFVEE